MQAGAHFQVVEANGVTAHTVTVPAAGYVLRRVNGSSNPYVREGTGDGRIATFDSMFGLHAWKLNSVRCLWDFRFD